MTRWFLSDLHIAHKLVAIERGFVLPNGEADFESYHETLAHNWDSVVRKDDLVYFLGDLAMNADKAWEWLDARPGRKVLVSGNHDETAPFHSKAPQAQREWLAHFFSIHDSLQLKFGAHRVLLSHYPYQGEGSREIEDRHTQWRLRDEGMPLLHGHTHSVADPANGHMYHVGLDAHSLELVHEQTIFEWLDSLESQE